MNKSVVKFLAVVFVSIVLAQSCTQRNDKQFRLLNHTKTGLDFENQVEQTIEFNIFDYMYFYNGGGVASADFNNDGLMDLYFTANNGSNKMFLNKGDLKFEDITEIAQAGGQSGGWTTGVSLVDINSDGLMDLYISQVGDYDVWQATNQLLVCQGLQDGIPVYEDRAIDYDLDLAGFSTQAVFADFDLDGDLDMFQLNHSLHQNGTFGPRQSFLDKEHATSGDRLLRNDNGRFHDVSSESGIISNVVGYGLGVVVSDINADGWPDIYVGNDFHENDYLYINQKDGTFSEEAQTQLMHTSRFSMGVDAADINNDGLSDLISLDMHPEDPVILKSSLGEDSFDVFMLKLGFGYQEQYARNNLQINNGNNTFTETGMFSGVFASDWSWAPLFVDFDNDGLKDIFISNGIPRRMNDIDYLNFMNSSAEQKERTLTGEVLKEDLEIVERMPQIKLQNKFYRNNNGLRFKDIDTQVANNQPSYSNGAVYADFDNDGDLDLVVNNIGERPFLYENLAELNVQTNSSFTIKLKGTEKNPNAIGARVLVKTDTALIAYENYPTRGFQSSALGHLVLGVGDSTQVREVLVVWPDRSFSVINDLSFSRLNEVTWKPGLPVYDFKLLADKSPKGPVVFDDITHDTSLDFVHKENTSFVEFNREPLIPYMVSREGPALAMGDINGDGLDDLFFGGAKREKAAFYIQTTDGHFKRSSQEAVEMDSVYEDVDAHWVDFDQDGDQDLIVASGGNEYWAPSPYLQPRLYINEGGTLTRDENAFKEALLTASTVAVADYDKDGWPDVFFGARALPRVFGETPESYLFRNQGDGTFSDVTDQVSNSLRKPGLVKDAVWSDLDNDNDADLILALDWDHVKWFRNENGRFSEQDLSQTKGWWNFVEVFDADNDGDLDIIAGNAGLNNKMKPTVDEPVTLYLNDFDDDGSKEQLLTYYVEGREIPFATHAELTGRLVSLKKRFLYATDFARSSVNDLFGRQKLESATVRQVNNAGHVLLLNDGAQGFQERLLPETTQFSSLNASVVGDWNGDGLYEVFLGGNFYPLNVSMGRSDANYGNLLYTGETGQLQATGLGGFGIKGEIRQARSITIGGRECLVLARNDESALILTPR